MLERMCVCTLISIVDLASLGRLTVGIMNSRPDGLTAEGGKVIAENVGAHVYAL